MIEVTAKNVKNGIGVILIFGILLILLVTYLNLKADVVNIVDLFLLSVCMIGILIGYLKGSEPSVILTLEDNELIYHHRYGHWRLVYSNILRVGIPKVSKGLEYKSLSYIGVSLVDLDDFLQGLHPRIAGKLLIEQRSLLRLAIVRECPDGTCPSDMVFDDVEYKSPAGVKYTGLIAMFANRMVNMKRLLGYELYIPTNTLDDDIDKVLALLRQVKTNQPLKKI